MMNNYEKPIVDSESKEDVVSLEEGLKPQVEKFFEEAIKIPEVKEALDLLDGLPENLVYHNKNHTFDVIRETILFGLADAIPGDILVEQCIAAAWHDVGYIKRYQNNEPLAVELFRNSRAYATLPEEKRKEIEADILDTQIVMMDGSPILLQRNSQFGYVLDGDVSNFGRDDYFEKGEAMMKELGITEKDVEKKKGFLKFALALLVNHKWKTEGAKKLRQAKMEENMMLLKQKYEAMLN